MTTTARESILQQRRRLEDKILRLCANFEEATGMTVKAVLHPADGHHDYGKRHDGNLGGRVQVEIEAPTEPKQPPTENTKKEGAK